MYIYIYIIYIHIYIYIYIIYIYIYIYKLVKKNSIDKNNNVCNLKYITTYTNVVYH